MSYAPQEDFPPPDRQGTDSSHYSCTGLASDHPERYVKASEARRQAQEAPDKRVRLASGPNSSRNNLAKYPKGFNNREQLDLACKKPRYEYPIYAKGSWDPEWRGRAEVTRVVYSNSDRNTFDVVYHDPRKGNNTRDNASIAPYRPAFYKRSGGSNK